MIDSHGRQYIQRAFDAMARPLIAMKVSPTHLTLTALFFGLGACALTCVITGRGLAFRLCILILGALSALCDILDGTVARMLNRSSPLGAFLDLITDRLIEALFIFAWTYAFPEAVWASMTFMTLVIMNFSIFLIAGNIFPNKGDKSFHYEGGLLERTETFILFALMLLFPSVAIWLLWIFCVLMVYTAVRRFTRVVQFARRSGLDGRKTHDISEL